jgi:hypothetical protein
VTEARAEAEHPPEVPEEMEPGKIILEKAAEAEVTREVLQKVAPPEAEPTTPAIPTA